MEAKTLLGKIVAPSVKGIAADEVKNPALLLCGHLRDWCIHVAEIVHCLG